MPTNRELSIILKMRDMATAQFKKASTAWGRGLIRVRRAAAAVGRRLKLLAAVAIAAVTYAFIKGIKSAIRYGLEIDKMAKVSGITAKQFSKLAYAAEQEHTSLETLTKAIPILSKYMAYAQQDQIMYQREFDKMGISVADTEGRLKSTYDVILEMSDFMGREGANDTEKMAIAMTLLGRRGAELIPMLKKGREWIEKMGDEAEILNIVLTAKTVAAMKRFDDKLLAVKRGMRGVWLGIAQGLLPHLDDLVKWMKDNMPVIIERAKELGDEIGQWVKNITEAETAWRKFVALFAKPFTGPAYLQTAKKEREELKNALGILEARERSLSFFGKIAEIVNKKQLEAVRKEIKMSRARIQLLDKFIEKYNQAKKQREEEEPPGEPPPLLPGFDKEAMAMRKRMLEEYAEWNLAIADNMTVEELKRFEKSLRAFIKFEEDKKRLKEEMSLEYISLTEGGMMAELETLTRTFEEYKKLYGSDGEFAALLDEVYVGKMNEIVAKYKGDMELVRQATEEAAKAMQRSMSDYFFDALTGQLKTTEDYIRGFGRMMARILSELMSQLIMTKILSSSIGGWFGGAGAGGAAKGARITQGEVQPLPYYAAGGAMVARGRAVPIVAHEGEWIGTPARLAAAGIGRDQPRETRPARNYTIIIQAMDAQSSKDWIETHRDEFVGMIQDAADDNDPIRRMG